MSIIDTAEKIFQKVHLKYFLGDLLLATWKPKLVVVDPKSFSIPNWPDNPDILQAVLPVAADGFLCRKVSISQFPIGIGKYGDFIRYVRYRDVLYYVNLSGNFDTYLTKFSAKSRQNMSRSVRNFLKRSPNSSGLETYTTPSDMPRFHEKAIAISKKTYQTLLLDSGLSESKTFVDQMIALAEKGDALGYILRDGEQAIAFAWCRKNGETIFYDTIGYLPKYGNLSPGTVLLYLILEKSFLQNEYKIFDFGPGEAQYKSMFATGRQEFIDTYLFRSTLNNRLLIHLHYRLSNLSSTIGAILDRLGLKRHLKQFIRTIKNKSI